MIGVILLVLGCSVAAEVRERAQRSLIEIYEQTLTVDEATDRILADIVGGGA